MKKYIKEMILLFISVFAAGTIFLIANTDKKSYEYEIVFLGDSVIGNHWAGKDVTDAMADRLGIEVFNGALGGTCMSFYSPKGWESVHSSQWSMVKLAQAIYADDWTSQRAAVSYSENYRTVNNQILDYFKDRIDILSKIDFSKTKVLLIEHGTNDYNCGQKLNSEEDPFDITTYGGALRTVFSLLQEKYPELRIILVSPTYCEFPYNEVVKCTEADFGGGILDEYVYMGQQIAEEYGVEWLDLYHDSGIRSDTIDIYTYDGLHLTDEGRLLIGNMIAEYLEENPW